MEDGLRIKVGCLLNLARLKFKTNLNASRKEMTHGHLAAIGSGTEMKVPAWQEETFCFGRLGAFDRTDSGVTEAIDLGKNIVRIN